MKFSPFQTNWSGAYGPATIGYVSNDSAFVTVSAQNCVDQTANFSVTALDLEPTPYPRALSAPQSISKNFTSTVTVTWQTTTITHLSYCNLVYDIKGTLNVSETNACRTVYASATSPDCSCVSKYQEFNSPNGNTYCSNCGGGSIGFGAGSYACEIWADSNPANLYVSFTDTNGVNHSGAITLPLNTSTTTVVSASFQ
jgi:hypothetical protein